MKNSTPNIIADISKATIHSAIKINLALMGPFGTILNEVIFGFHEKINALRAEKFLVEVNERLNQLESKSEFEGLKTSEEFHDLVSESLKIALKTSSETKRRMLAKYLIENVIDQSQVFSDYNQLRLRYIDELTPTHVIILNHLVRNCSDYKKLNRFRVLYEKFLADENINLEYSYFRALVRDLEIKTLCVFSPNVLEYGSSGGYVEAADSRIVPGLFITELGASIASLSEEN